MIKAIIFDIDGVVFKSVGPDGRYLWSKNIAVDLNLRSNHFKKIYGPEWDLVTRGKLDTLKYLNSVFTDPIFDDINITAESYLDYWLKHDQFIDEEMIAFVKTVHVPVYIGTNQDRHRTEHIKKLVGQHFEKCFSSCESGFIKPEEGFYQFIEQELYLNPEELLLIDDTKVNVEAAQLRGWEGYFYEGSLQQLNNYLKTHV